MSTHAKVYHACRVMHYNVNKRMCACTHACMGVCMYRCMYTCMYGCMHYKHVCCGCVQVCMHTTMWLVSTIIFSVRIVHREGECEEHCTY